MFVEIDGTPWAVLPVGDGTVRVYDLSETEFRGLDAPPVLDEHTARKLVERVRLDDLKDRTVEVNGVEYIIAIDSESYTQIQLNGEFFAEADWDGPMDKDDAIALIREELGLEDEDECSASVLEREEGNVGSAPYAAANELVPCGGCGGSGKLAGSDDEALCPICGGEASLSRGADLMLRNDLTKYGRFIVTDEDGVYWSLSHVGSTLFASSPGYPGVEMELEFFEMAMTDENILHAIREERLHPSDY